MFTPQQLTELGFTKAVFGGYDMESVHDVLDPLTEDYTTLYKENAVLKSKLRILVEKLEEYRRQGAAPAAAQAASGAADQEAKEILRKAEEQAAGILREAREQAAGILGEAQDSASRNARACAGELQAEEDRLAQAKEAAASFIYAMEKDIRHHLELLDNLKMLDLPEHTEKAPEEKEVFKAPAPLTPKVAEPSEDPDEIARQIEHNLEKIVSSVPNSTFDASVQDTKVMRPLHPESITAKFGDLQFGKNYNPK
ncbi:MAG: DivIVA domain-containing protein [Ruminococcaceae bacterium]|nr:DivIVA domain-containing protein [Oscillospiraceae bacterium]